MAGNVRISSPEEVSAQIKRIAALLALYQEGLEEEVRQISAVGQQLEAVRQKLTRRRTDLQTALEQTKAQSAQSEAAGSQQRSLEDRLRACEEMLRQLAQQDAGYADIGQNLAYARQRSQQLAADGKLLSGKMGTLLSKIIELT